MDDWKKMMEEYDKAWAAAKEKSDSLPDGFQVGKILTVGVADGQAVYEIVKVNKATVDIEWRQDLSLDDYQCHMLGAGGRWRKEQIEHLVRRADGFRKIFGKGGGLRKAAK